MPYIYKVSVNKQPRNKVIMMRVRNAIKSAINTVTPLVLERGKMLIGNVSAFYIDRWILSFLTESFSPVINSFSFNKSTF